MLWGIVRYLEGRSSKGCLSGQAKPQPELCQERLSCAKVYLYMIDQHFTLEEANTLLPWLEEKFSQMVPVRDDLAVHQEELIALLRRRRSNGHSSSEEEIAQAQGEVDQLIRDLQQLLQEVSQQGILVRDVGRGLVDFPSIREGREVHLCWLRGESQIDYWHETNIGFAGRQPL